ncbi:MAG TPA: TIGR00730 family Rossman fold protein [Oceanospirillales bacterium]|nr:TIGR00730 family Rossman fold protein [Oleispira sp.]HCM04498.1 TIGR00730 family Rossman fold protein [Oceanospirillales bacterium]|tara:strand:+ start:4745 stop:5620 length:876 start_codon:yes stop_codon:yes gene_type:complete
MDKKDVKNNLLSIEEEQLRLARKERMNHPSYRLAYDDDDFFLREDMRALRLQLEWVKPDIIQKENNIESTVVVFGGARFKEKKKAEQQLLKARDELSKNPDSEESQRKIKIAESVCRNSRFYEESRLLAQKITRLSQQHGGKEFVVVTGGGPGVMEAANRGAADEGGQSIGLNIVLPFEQEPNPYITPELCFQFDYFAIRKMHFLKRAKGLVAFPGGFGTLDELFETLTLIQTKKMQPFPIVLIGKEYWSRLIDFDFLAEQGAVSEADIKLFHMVDTAGDAYEHLSKHWGK